MVAYISMAFGNPYGDAWSETKVVEAAKKIADSGIHALSLADTVGAAGPDLIRSVMENALSDCSGLEIGAHLHSTRAGAQAKILAALEAGCRRFDSALGGLGGCPFAQNDLVGNIPTEEVLLVLEQRGVTSPLADVQGVLATNAEISREFAAG